MARVCPQYDSDDDLPELDDIINNHLRVKAPNASKISLSELKNRQSRQARSPEQVGQQIPKRIDSAPIARSGTERQPKPLSKRLFADRHVRLQPIENRRKPVSDESQTSKLLKTSGPVPVLSPSKSRATPARSAKQAITYDGETDDASVTSEESELEESIWCHSSIVSNSDNEEEDDLFRAPMTQPLFLRRSALEDLDKSQPNVKSVSVKRPERKKAVSEEFFDAVESIARPKPATSNKYHLLDCHFSDKENDDGATLHFSPPRLQRKPPDFLKSRPCTPPPTASPTKSKLNSPSKKNIRIPTPPGRPGLDAFWDAAHINEWHDTYSPQKPLVSTRKNRFQPSSSTSPTMSPAKAPSSPTKRSRAEIETRKTFDSQKESMAQSFLEILDRKIANSSLSALAQSTGGVRLVWSKTLNSTAGRASWKKVTARSASDTIVHHHATIELAAKVLTGEAQLYNTLAHEFCHLANFMISGIRDQPHGASFKTWGRKVTAAFGGSHGVEVTTKHKYEIEYKYLWTCEGEGCGVEFGRHSKSIDPARQRCGTCKGRLRQVRPVPRGSAAAENGEKSGGEKKLGTYAAFVKEHYAAIKKDMGKASQKEVMEAVGRKYREEKARLAETGKQRPAKEEDGGINDVAKALEVIVLDD